MAVSAVEKILCRSLIASVLQISRAIPKGNGSPKRVETAGVYPFGFPGETAGVPLASQAKSYVK